MNLWPRVLRRRWEQREAEADQAESRLLEAKAQHARAQRLAAEAVQIRHMNGFTEAIRASMGVRR